MRGWPARRGSSDRAAGQDDRTAAASADGERLRGEVVGEKVLDPAA